MNGRNLKVSMSAMLVHQLQLPAKTRFGPKIGTESVNGVIFPILDTDRVVKITRIESGEQMNDFRTEVQIGHMPGIKKVGTQIYNSKIFDLDDGTRLGAYVMENLLARREIAKGTGLPSYKVIPMSKYMKVHETMDRPEQNRSVRMYEKLLFDFYKITRGWHGDLHNENIQVILDGYGKLVRMKIIDYGSHVMFKNQNRINNARTLRNILQQITNETAHFNNRKPYARRPPRAHKNFSWPGGARAYNADRNRSQPIIRNSNILLASTRARETRNTKHFHQLFPYVHLNRNLTRNCSGTGCLQFISSFFKKKPNQYRKLV
jgi:hypothetical protein